MKGYVPGLECICLNCHTVQKVRLRRGVMVKDTPCVQCNTKSLRRKWDYDNAVESGRIQP